jgi:hypothetical protein
MPGRATDLIVIPDSFWQRDEVRSALRNRAIGRLFELVRQHTGASQTRIGIACDMSQSKVSDIIRGVAQVETLAVFERIADAFSMPDPARIGLGLAPQTAAHGHAPSNQRTLSIPPRDTGAPLPTGSVSSLLSLNAEGEQEEEPVRRREFVGLAGAAMFSAMLTGATTGSPLITAADPLAPVLTGHTTESLKSAPSLVALTAAVNRARREYQACRYADLLKYLPGLLARLHATSQAVDGDTRLRVHALSADAHHVAAGLLLKLDDLGLAYLAADRSMRAARASEDPLITGASARIITHTLMRGGHHATATTTASSYAAQLDHSVDPHTPESLSVYGSLLLRGAIAAAEQGNRGTAHELLDEADAAGQRLGIDANLRGTAFGPANAKQHRVNIAVTLGDAGTAVDVARSIDLNSITVTERKACLLIDTARAFLQWGKHDKAYIALRAAEQTAPEEVAGRPTVRRLVRQLATTAPPTLRRDAEQFAAQIGATHAGAAQ